MYLDFTPAELARFWAKVHKTPTCWLWTGATRGGGYGEIGTYRQTFTVSYAHRVSSMINVGPIPEGMTIDHLCRVRACVNPAHLEVVTQAENNRRQWAARKKKPAV